MPYERCTVQEVCTLLGGSEKLLSELRERLEDWLKLQPHLPQDIPGENLEWFIIQTKFSLEKAKQKLDMYYTIRSLVPEYFRDRDPRKLVAAPKPWRFVIFPNLTPEKYRVVLFQLTSRDSSLFDAREGAKYGFMSLDVQMHESYHDCGIQIVYDLSVFSLAHLLKITPVDMKKWEIVCLKAYALRVKGIHFINAPAYIDRLLTMVKAALSKKISDRIHVYQADDFGSFYRVIPRSVLPKDYGGELPTVDELAAEWNAKVEAWRDWLLEQENVLVDERLRPGPAFDKDSLFGFSGSFRKLDVD